MSTTKFASTYYPLTHAIGGLLNGKYHQTAMLNISNSGLIEGKLHIKITLGTDPVEGTVPIHLIEGDGQTPESKTDGAADTAGDFTDLLNNAPLLDVLDTGDSPVTGKVLEKTIVLPPLAGKVGIVVGNLTGVDFDGNDANHKLGIEGKVLDTS